MGSSSVPVTSREDPLDLAAANDHGIPELDGFRCGDGATVCAQFRPEIRHGLEREAAHEHFRFGTPFIFSDLLDHFADRTHMQQRAGGYREQVSLALKAASRQGS